MPRRQSAVADDDHLASLGVQQELKRNFNPLSMLGLAFAILNSWTALSTSLSLALPSGGATAVLWGLLTAGICNLAIASSLAEFLSAYPTAGGQYHWTAIVSWKKYMPILSWLSGWITVFGWMALTATGGLLGSQLIVGIIAMYSPTYHAKRWQQFLIYIGYNIGGLLINAFGNSILPAFNRAAIIWSVSGFVIISITVLACSSPNYHSGTFVFTEFLNETGWPNGLAWLLGLLQGGLGITGYDATSHMIEEIPNAAIEGPKIMVYCVLIGMFTGFIFLTCLLFVPGDVQDIISSSDGPLGRIILNATNSRAGTVCLLMFPLVCLVFATTSIMTTSSRMTYAFARDGGLPFSRFFARVHRRLDVPLEALGLTVLVVIVFGCLFLGSSSAFNAIVSASVVSLSISYAIPIAINCLQGRRMLPPTRHFILPNWLGWTANILGVLYVVLTSVLFILPPVLPVTGNNMNYCSAVLIIVLIICLITWFADGRKNFKGPKVELVDQQVLTATESPRDLYDPDKIIERDADRMAETSVDKESK